MKLNCSWQVRLAQALLGAILVIGLVVVSGTNAQNDPVHVTHDWSHRHLVFSTPKTLIQRIQFSSNHPYVQQWVRRFAEQKVDPQAWRWKRAEPESMKGDWSMNMGSNAKLGQGMYPAKFSFDATTANCGTAPQPDFVVYNTSLAGNSTAVAATAQGVFNGLSVAGSTIVFTNPSLGTVLTMTPGAANAHTGVGTGTYIASAALATEAGNLRTAINIFQNGSFVGITSPSTAGGAVNFTATTAGTAGNGITMAGSVAPASHYSANITFTGGANGQASIMAFDNLYSGCTGIKPSPYWAYNTGGQVVTSPTLSYDGSQVGFIQTQAGIGTLVLLKWKSSATENFNNPTTLANTPNAGYRACTAPCMTTIAFNVTGRPLSDTNSSVFYDIPSDTMFVGGNGADLRKFTGVFQATPAEVCAAGCGVTQAGWPVLLTGNNISTGPVFDESTGKIFIADNGGFLYAITNPVSPALPVVTKSARVGFSLGIVDTPIVDPVAGKVYVFVSNDSATLPATGNSSRVFQFSTSFAAGTSGSSVTVGDSSGAVKGFAGDFDNAYYTSAAGNAGHLYVCGSVTGAVNYIPALWQISMVGGTLGAPVQGPTLATTNATTCGPVVEIFNPNAGVGTDWIFTSVTANKITAAPISCPVAGGAGCIMSFDVTSGLAISPATTTVGHTAVTGGASGVSFDNTVGAGTLAGASQVYFTPLLNQVCTTSGGTGGCAIQASQSNLN